jgi:hypothetical protein
MTAVGRTPDDHPTSRPDGPATMPAILPLVRGIAWDIALNATIPVVCYYVAKRLFHVTDFAALLAASLFPAMKSVWDVRQKRELDPVTLLILLGIASSALALVATGDQRMLLIRESFFTGAFGIACLISLVLPRPMMFYFGRYLIAGGDEERRRVFDSRWQYPAVRRAHRRVTIVWGVVFFAEFLGRVGLVYALRPTLVLAVAPIVTGLATIGTIVWTLRYAARVRQRLAA